MSNTSKYPVSVHTGGLIYKGWKDVKITRGIDRLSGTFKISLTEKFPGQPQRWTLEPGADVHVYLGKEPVITGYIDRVHRHMDSRSYSVEIQGRDKACDLIDCSAMWQGQNKFGKLNNPLKLIDIAKILCEPFGIDVINDSGSDPIIHNISIDPGDTVWDIIQVLEMGAGMRFCSDGLGNIVAIKGGGSRMRQDGLKLGENILDARFIRENTKRFSDYHALSQLPGSDYCYGDIAALQSAHVNDPAVKRHRPIVTVASNPFSGEQLKEYAGWRKRYERGVGRKLEVVVVGWGQDGYLWQPNELVHVDADVLGIHNMMLISAVENNLSKQGTTTTLELVPKEAYERFPQGFDESELLM